MLTDIIYQILCLTNIALIDVTFRVSQNCYRYDVYKKHICVNIDLLKYLL